MIEERKRMILQKMILILKKFYLGILILVLLGILFPLTVPDINLSVILFVFFLVLVCVVISRIDIKCYPFILFVTMLSVRVVTILKIDVDPVSDFEVLYSSALELVHGHNNMLDSAYYKLWAYQAGYVGYLAILLLICESLVFLKIVNCIWSAGICVLVYLIAREICHKRVAKFISLGYGLFPFPLLFNCVLSNQIPATFFFYLAIFLMIKLYRKKATVWKYWFPGFLLALGNVLRPEAIVFVCAGIGCYILRVYKEEVKRSLVILVIFCLAYFTTFEACSLVVKCANLNQYGLVNNDSEWKFVLGLNQETNGKYSQKDAEMYLGNSTAEQAVIKERLGQFDLTNIGEFLKSKERSILSGGILSWSLQKWEKSEAPYLWMQNVNGVFHLFFYILMIIGITFSLKSAENDDVLMFINILVITMVVYALIEVQPRYAYVVQVSVFLLAAKGCNNIRKIATQIKRKEHNYD